MAGNKGKISINLTMAFKTGQWTNIKQSSRVRVQYLSFAILCYRVKCNQEKNPVIYQASNQHFLQLRRSSPVFFPVSFYLSFGIERGNMSITP